MSDFESKFDAKLDKVVDKITCIEVTLGKQHVCLEEHIRRTNLLEDQMKPVTEHVAMVHGILKFVGFLALLGTIIEGLMSLLTYIHGK